MGSPVSYRASVCGTPLAPPACVREAGAAPAKPRLLDRVRFALRLRHYSRRTEDAYIAWIRRYVLFHGKRHPADMRATELTAFLSSGGRPPRGGVRPEPGPQRAPVPLPRRARAGRSVARRSRARKASLARPGCPHPRRSPGGSPTVERGPAPHGVLAVWLGTPSARMLPPPCSGRRSRNPPDRRACRQGRRGSGHVLPAVIKRDLARHLDRGRAQHQRDLQSGAAGSSFRRRSPESTRTPRVNGCGSGSSPRRASTGTALPGSSARTTCTNPCCSVS